MHIALLAGEASGDQLGANLITALRKINPSIRFDGVGGPKMTALGFHSLIPMSKLSVMGISEVLLALPRLLSYQSFLYEHYQSSMPDAFIAIDFPDFNLALEAKLKRMGIYTVHYVSPSVWAWREKRVHKIREACELMLTLFDFEKKFYDQEGINAIFCGHPLADIIPEEVANTDPFKLLNIKDSKHRKRLAILPGSRSAEIKKLLPVFLDIAQDLQSKHMDLDFILPAANEAIQDEIDAILKKTSLNNLTIVLDNARAAMMASDAVLLASGTATLEAALLEKPMLVAYKVSALTGMIGKHMINTPHFALPNIIADDAIVPEYIQDGINIEEMAATMESLLYNDRARKKMIMQLREVKKKVMPGGSERASKAIYQAIIQSGLKHTTLS